MTSKPTNPELEPLSDAELAMAKEMVNDPRLVRTITMRFTIRRLIAEVERSRQQHYGYGLMKDGKPSDDRVYGSIDSADYNSAEDDQVVELFWRAQPHQEGIGSTD